MNTQSSTEKTKGKITLAFSTFSKCFKTRLTLMEDFSQHDEEENVKFNTLPINESSGY